MLHSFLSGVVSLGGLIKKKKKALQLTLRRRLETCVLSNKSEQTSVFGTLIFRYIISIFIYLTFKFNQAMYSKCNTLNKKQSHNNVMVLDKTHHGI